MNNSCRISLLSSTQSQILLFLSCKLFSLCRECNIKKYVERHFFISPTKVYCHSWKNWLGCLDYYYIQDASTALYLAGYSISGSVGSITSSSSESQLRADFLLPLPVLSQKEVCYSSISLVLNYRHLHGQKCQVAKQPRHQSRSDQGHNKCPIKSMRSPTSILIGIISVECHNRQASRIFMMTPCDFLPP